MVWSSWKGTLVVTLLWAGLAWGQQPQTPSPAGETCGELYVTIDEPGLPHQQCRVLSYWRLDNGCKACDVQSLDTGEMMTIVDGPEPGPVRRFGSGGLLEALRKRICHWGSMRTRPPGFPAPPDCCTEEGCTCSDPECSAPQNGAFMPYQQGANQRLQPIPAGGAPGESIHGPSAHAGVPMTEVPNSGMRLTPSPAMPGSAMTATPGVASGTTLNPYMPGTTSPGQITQVPGQSSSPYGQQPQNGPGMTGPSYPGSTTGVPSRSYPASGAVSQAPAGSLPAPWGSSMPGTVAGQSANGNPSTWSSQPSGAAPAFGTPGSRPGPNGVATMPSTAKTAAGLPTASRPALWSGQAAMTTPGRASPGSVAGMTSSGQPAPGALPPSGTSASSGTTPGSSAGGPSLPAPGSVAGTMGNNVPGTPTWPAASVGAALPANRTPASGTTLPGFPDGRPAAPSQTTPGNLSRSPGQPAAGKVVSSPTAVGPGADLKSQAAQNGSLASLATQTPAQAPENKPLVYAKTNSSTGSNAQPKSGSRLHNWLFGPGKTDKQDASHGDASSQTAASHTGTAGQGSSPAWSTADGSLDWHKSWSQPANGKPAQKVAAAEGSLMMPGRPLALPASATPPTSRTVTDGGADPLTNPGIFNPRSVEDKMAQKGNGSPASADKGLRTASAKQLSGGPQGNPTPMGAESVLAANNGMRTPIRYVPVPVVTMPESQLPSGPPPPNVPQPPAPNAYVNAFSPPLPAKVPQDQEAGAFAPQANAIPTYLPPAAPVGYTPAGYTPMPQGMMPQGPGYAMVPAMYPPSSYYGMGPPMMPAMYPGAAMPARNMGQGTVSVAYQGPMPPNPAPGGMPLPQMPMPAAMPMPMPLPNPMLMPVGYTPVGFYGQPWPTVPYANPAMDRQGIPVSYQVPAVTTLDALQQMLTTLRTSLYPAQREWAASSLVNVDWRTQPQVLQALLIAAREDPAPTVRTGCVNCLGKMNVSVDLVSTTLQGLREDVDPRVRQAADQVLARLSTPGPRP